MDKVKARVVGGCEINGVQPGGQVTLDPEVVNIDALVAAGHVEVLDAPKGDKPVSRRREG